MTRPTATILTILAAALLLAAPLSAAAASRLDERLDSATAVLEKFTQIPEQGIPPALLRNAYGIAVIPGMIKAGFWIGGSYGKGIIVVRNDDGRWSNPAFISVGAGSFGPQFGAQSTDIILVFKSQKSLERITNGKLKLGGDAGVAAGPVGRRTSASTDLRLNAEIYSYARTRGLFVGISLEGAVIGMDKNANYAFYEYDDGTADRILHDPNIPTPAHARNFIETLSSKAPPLEWQPQGSRTAGYSRTVRDAEPMGARTYGIDEAPPPRSDAVY